MKRLILWALLVSTSTEAADKFLKYRFNENVDIVISNLSCPFKELKEQYFWAVVANRSDGQRLFGCYTHRGDNIVIQWFGGDKTILPSDYFLEYAKS